MNHTPSDLSPTRTSGGEQSPEITAKCNAIAKLIEKETDVLRVIGISFRKQDGKFLYFIETPFETFPKFVIGITDAANESPRILAKCGMEWHAMEEWRRTLEFLNPMKGR